MIFFQLSEIFIHSRPCAWTGTLTLLHFRLHDETLTSHARCPRFYPARRRGFHRPGLKIILNDVTLIDTLIEKKLTVPNRRDSRGGGEKVKKKKTHFFSCKQSYYKFLLYHVCTSFNILNFV